MIQKRVTPAKVKEVHGWEHATASGRESVISRRAVGLSAIVTHFVSQCVMQSVNLRQLRDTRQLKEWLAAGETVELRERDRVLAKIVPERPDDRPREWPDFEARLKEMWGDRVFPAVDTLLEDRENSRF
jgi:antitoxin (DNA-binding transcriptional repressor) of toxin-antitoxin stability system